MESGGVSTVVVTAALSVIGTLGVTYFGHWLGLSKDKELRQEELDRHARYLAIRIVCVLDPFVSGCCDVVQDNGQPDQEGEMHPSVSDPTISFPADVDWKSIKPELMYSILSFPNELDIARQSILAVADLIASPPNYEEYFEERTIQFGRLGLAALVLADEIRETYGIPRRNDEVWSPRETLERCMANAQKIRDESQARQTGFMKSITENTAAKSPEVE